MRKLIYGINLTMDGCCEHTSIPHVGDDVHQYFRELLEDSGTLLYGRKTYELMVPFWPDIARSQSLDESSNAFAKAFDRLERVVVSRTLDNADERTTIIRDNLKEEVLKLKQQAGKAISTGGVALPAELIELGLIDEFHVVVHPFLCGQGRRLFSEMHLPETMELKLLSTKTLPSGCIALRYEKF
ncbi:dihydrofolate reductase family protein [Pedobacter deserti]|uniref:dihydrofolate reductase family protein n=1 Tax=Pedobacter deserti TaxID=2817382 RepID=UPI00210E425A|nr:dihydrofolate reductase family protein [Pedobacter sp. SYSU D00382]